MAKTKEELQQLKEEYEALKEIMLMTDCKTISDINTDKIIL